MGEIEGDGEGVVEGTGEEGCLRWTGGPTMLSGA